MTKIWSDLIIFTSIPAIMMALGGIIALFKTPGPRLTSTIQHLAAGVVFGAVAAELIPKVINQSNWFMAIGFVGGVILMLLVDYISHQINERSASGSKLPLGMLTTVGIDVFIDGILIGVSFLASQKSGLMITAALTLEVFFLGLSSSTSLTKTKINRKLSVAILIGIAILIPIGAILGYGIVSQLSESAHMAILAFGVAALLYLVTEELLTEAHAIKETPYATSAFFIGFLIILLFA